MDIKRIVELSKEVAVAELALATAKGALAAEVRKAAGTRSETVTQVMGHSDGTKVVQVYRTRTARAVSTTAPPRTARERVTAVLTDKPQRARDIAKAAGVQQDHTGGLMRELVRDKIAAKVGRGLYQLRGAAK